MIQIVELRGGPFDGKRIAVGKGVVRTELPLSIGDRTTMHEYVRSDTAVPVFRHNGHTLSDHHTGPTAKP